MQRVFSRFALLAVAAFFVRAASADEELLYFLIDDPLTFNDGTTLSSSDYSFAMVAFSADGVDPSGEYLTLYGGGGTAQGQAISADSAEAVYAALGNSPTDTILFELWLESPEGSFERVAYHSASLSDLRAHIASSTAQGGATPYVVHSVVPEPSGGLLMLLGLAGLALRRKRNLI